MRNLFTEEEIIVCTYIARFGRENFKESDIQKIKIANRSESSIRMKVQNIASMLDEAGYKCSKDVGKLTGLPPGQKGRKTNWNVVKQFATLSKENHYKKCTEIFHISE